jgi:ribosomal protein S18 acetylase RimI-like enzyme
MSSLLAFDRKVFPVSDRFEEDYWRTLTSYWMLIDRVKVGCCAFEKNVDFQEDIRDDETNPPMHGSLFIATTAILPRYRGAGLGQMLKCWQICYARRHRFPRIVTNVRKRNTNMLRINQRFGFEVIRTTQGYYSGPNDSTVVMELCLTLPPAGRLST